MKQKLIPNQVVLPRTLIDLIDDHAPKVRSKFIVTLIDSYYQHKTDLKDFSEFNDPEDDLVGFTLRLPPLTQKKFEELCHQRIRMRSNMLTIICASDIMKRFTNVPSGRHT